MKTLLLLLAILPLGLNAQKLHSLKDLEADTYKENVTIEALSSDENQSSYVIWVSDTVRPHYHADHTECIYLLEGGGIFYLGEETIEMKAGDFIMIPKGAIHSFKHKTGRRSKVLSVQTPKFHGKDRIWVEEQPR